MKLPTRIRRLYEVRVEPAGHRQPYEGAFIGRTHEHALRVYFEDTDAGGVVYHAAYLRFMERARSDMLRAIGIDQRAALECGTGVYAVVDLSIKYRVSARLDDALLVLSEIREVKAATCLIQQRVMRRKEIVAEALVRVAFLAPNGRPKRQPAEWQDKFRRMWREDTGV